MSSSTPETIESLTTKLAKSNKALEEITANARSFYRELQELRERYSNDKDAQQAQRNQATFRKLANDFKEVSDKHKQCEKTIEVLEASNRRVGIEKGRADKKIEDLKSQNTKFAEKLKKLEASVQQQAKELRSAKITNDAVQTLQSETERLQAELLSSNNSLEVTKDKLKEERETVKGLKREIRGFEVIQRQRDALQKSEDKLEKQLEKSETTRRQLGDKMSLCFFCLKFLAPIRLRWMYSSLDSKKNNSEMQAGNKAAHGSNVLVDLALFSLGILAEKYRPLFCEMYQFPFEEFVGSPAALQPLMNEPKLVNLVNMRGSMAGYFAFSKKTLCVDSTVDDFLALEARCKEILAQAYKDTKSKKEARDAYAANTETTEKQAMMMSLVLVMAALHKNRHNVTNASTTS